VLCHFDEAIQLKMNTHHKMTFG